MATLTKGKTFANGELVTPQKLHELVDLGTVSGIMNADIANNAAISDTKLATISTANKVAQSAVANLTTDLAGKAAASHTHTIANVTGLQTALDGKQASGSYAPATGIAQSAVTNLTTDLAGKAASSHTHDDRYYTETEIDTKLSAIPTTSTINSFSAYPTLNQNIANNILTKVLFQETYWNKNSNFQNSRFTPSVAGIYFLTATITSNITGLAGKSYVIQLVKNGSNILQVNTQSTIQGLFQLNGITDYVEVFLFNSSGSLIALNISPEQTYFQGFFLSQL